LKSGAHPNRDRGRKDRGHGKLPWLYFEAEPASGLPDTRRGAGATLNRKFGRRSIRQDVGRLPCYTFFYFI
jgi:hypothetical protein